MCYMRIGSNKRFDKMFSKAPMVIKKKFTEKISLMELNPNDISLRKHKLNGKYKDFFSIDITGDWRAIFAELENGDLLFFVLFGTHSELYG